MALFEAILLLFAGPEAGAQSWEIGGGACPDDKTIHACIADKTIHGCPDDKTIHACPDTYTW